MSSEDFHRLLSVFIDFMVSMDCWVAGLARLAGLAGRSALLLCFIGRRLEPCSPPRSTLGEVGEFS